MVDNTSNITSASIPPRVFQALQSVNASKVYYALFGFRAVSEDGRDL
jgi:hypothetical protein